VERNINDRDYLQKHYASLLTLMIHAQPFEALHCDLIALLLALNPLPFQWGAWEEWEGQLRIGVQIATALGLMNERAILLDYLCAILLACGNMAEANALASQFLHQGVQSARSFFVAVFGILTSLLYQNDLVGLRTLLTTVEGSLYVETGDSLLRAAYVETIYGICARRLGEPLAKALGHLDAAVTAVNAWPPGPDSAMTSAEIHRERGVVRWAAGLYDGALVDFVTAIRVFQQQGDLFRASVVIGNQSLVYWQMGDLVQAERCSRESQAIAQRLHAHFQYMREAGNLALIALARGNLPLATASVTEHLRVAYRLGAALEVSRATGNRGVILVHQSEYGEAKTDLISDAAECHRAGSVEGLVFALAYLAVTHHYLGSRLRASVTLRVAQQHAASLKSRSLEAMCTRVELELASSEERLKIAQAELDSGLLSGREMDRAAFMLAVNLTPRSVVVKLLRHMGADGWARRVRQSGATEWITLPL
jgi:tetratricopeptide (TPR) repeat protein